MSALPSILDVNVSGKTILVRADLNVPLHDHKVGDRTRLERFSSTLMILTSRGAKVAVLSHLGRPKGPDRNLSLQVVAYELPHILGQPVSFIEDCVGQVTELRLRSLPHSSVAVLENLRFHREEEKNDRNFALRLSVLGDIYVNDAFSCAHRAHASTHAITEFLPSYAGPSLLEEVRALESALEAPRRPVGALVGGSKVSTKIAVLETLLAKMDVLVILGGMANTFLHAQGVNVGRSLCEPGEAWTALRILETAKAVGCRIILPVDGVASSEYAANAAHRIVANDAIPAQSMVLDAGPATVAEVNEAIDGLSTLLWNGPAGAFELKPFDAGTNAIARHVAMRTREGRLLSVAGGGDTVAALSNAGVADGFSYLSTAGGAFLEWLEGEELPGISILKTRNALKKGA